MNILVFSPAARDLDFDHVRYKFFCYAAQRFEDHISISKAPF